MEEKKTGKNVSSGAKKVENIEKAASQKTNKKPAAKKTNAQTSEAAQAEKRLSEARETAAKKERKYLERAQLKQKKIEKKARLKENLLENRAKAATQKAERKQQRGERIAREKQLKAERKAQKIARRELLKNESKADRQKRLEREKKERLALKKQALAQKQKAREEKTQSREKKRERNAESRKHKREQKTQRRQHAPGFGGWLAAVISLGVACLALATVVTAGSMNMNDLISANTESYRATLFEMTSASKDMDDNLSRLRVMTGAEEQQSALTNLLVNAALMESSLERVPIEAVTGTDISAFVNNTNSYCRKLLSRLADGEPLTDSEKSTLNYLYEVNAGLYRELNEMVTHMTEEEFKAFLKGKEGTVSQSFTQMGQGTLAEPEETVEAPFSNEGNVGKNNLASQEEVSGSRAEELAKGYLESYRADNLVFTGESMGVVPCYNFTAADGASGKEIYVQISKQGGKLVFLSTYEACADKNFDLEECDSLARSFLSSIGIENVEAVWLTDADRVADLTYVTVQNGVRVYPELIRIRVCEQRGRVVGMDAMQYYLNQEERSFESALSMEEAKANLSKDVEVYAAHPALVPVNGEEILTYEFACTMGEDEYVIYLDAQTGKEVQVFRVRDSARGSYIDR